MSLLNRPNPLLELRPRVAGAARAVLIQLRTDDGTRAAWREAERIAELPLAWTHSSRLSPVRPAFRVLRSLIPVKLIADAAQIPEAVFEPRDVPGYFTDLPMYLTPPFVDTPENEARNLAWQFNSFQWMREHVSTREAIKLIRVIGNRDIVKEVMQATVDMIGVAKHYAKVAREDFIDAFGSLPTARELEKMDDMIWTRDFLENVRQLGRPRAVALA